MVRVFMLYEQEPDPARYEQHAELCRKVPGVTFRHGKVFGAPFGEPKFQYYAEMEFADMEAFTGYTGSEAQLEWYKIYEPVRERSTTHDITN